MNIVYYNVAVGRAQTTDGKCDQFNMFVYVHFIVTVPHSGKSVQFFSFCEKKIQFQKSDSLPASRKKKKETKNLVKLISNRLIYQGRHTKTKKNEQKQSHRFIN